jgi:hypothetical protein
VTRTTVAPAARVLAPLCMLPPGYAIRVASSLVVLVMLAGVSAFAAREAHAGPSTGPSQASLPALRAMARSAGSGLPSAASMTATPEYSGSDGPSFRNDADNEEDGTGDAFDVIAIVALWVLLLGDGGLLLALRGVPAKLFSMCFLALGRPG